MLITIRIIIQGKVQGVFYRQSAREKAISLGITGTACNLPDETVEIIATGNNEQLEQFIKWCGTGPSRAIVTNIESTPLPLQTFENFSIIRF